jgi:hypothetical protein
MLTALLITIREGFEAALIVAIVYAYLRRIRRTDLDRAMWQGVLAATAVAVVAGAVIHGHPPDRRLARGRRAAARVRRDLADRRRGPHLDNLLDASAGAGDQG